MAVFLAYFIFGEAMTLIQVFGAVMILLGLSGKYMKAE